MAERMALPFRRGTPLLEEGYDGIFKSLPEEKKK